SARTTSVPSCRYSSTRISSSASHGGENVTGNGYTRDGVGCDPPLTRPGKAGAMAGVASAGLAGSASVPHPVGWATGSIFCHLRRNSLTMTSPPVRRNHGAAPTEPAVETWSRRSGPHRRSGSHHRPRCTERALRRTGDDDVRRYRGRDPTQASAVGCRGKTSRSGVADGHAVGSHECGSPTDRLESLSITPPSAV